MYNVLFNEVKPEALPWACGMIEFTFDIFEVSLYVDGLHLL